MTRGIYAVVDHVSQDVAGPLMVYRHAAVAVRAFTDLITNVKNIHDHVEDYALVKLGELNDDLTITPTNETILDGATWAATQQENQGNTTPDIGGRR